MLAADRERWAELWRGYLDFYETQLPPEIYDHTWQRLIAADGAIRGLGARLGSDTTPRSSASPIICSMPMPGQRARSAICRICSSTPAARRHGVGGKLIEAVAAIARERGCLRLYWTTKEDNATARSLYDRIARFNGFIRYDYAAGLMGIGQTVY